MKSSVIFAPFLKKRMHNHPPTQQFLSDRYLVDERSDCSLFSKSGETRQRYLLFLFMNLTSFFFWENEMKIIFTCSSALQRPFSYGKLRVYSRERILQNDQNMLWSELIEFVSKSSLHWLIVFQNRIVLDESCLRVRCDCSHLQSHQRVLSASSRRVCSPMIFRWISKCRSSVLWCSKDSQTPVRVISAYRSTACSGPALSSQPAGGEGKIESPLAPTQASNSFLADYVSYQSVSCDRSKAAETCSRWENLC